MKMNVDTFTSNGPEFGFTYLGLQTCWCQIRSMFELGLCLRDISVLAELSSVFAANGCIT